MVQQRLPIVDGDDGQWGDILNQYIEKEHYNTGVDNADNGGHKTITIRPGTAVAGTAPLKFASGSLLSSTEAGAIEYLSGKFYIRGTDQLSVAGNISTSGTVTGTNTAIYDVAQIGFTLSGSAGATATVKLPYNVTLASYEVKTDVATTCSIGIDTETITLTNEALKSGASSLVKTDGQYISATVNSNDNASVIYVFLKGTKQ